MTSSSTQSADEYSRCYTRCQTLIGHISNMADGVTLLTQATQQTLKGRTNGGFVHVCWYVNINLHVLLYSSASLYFWHGMNLSQLNYACFLIKNWLRHPFVKSYFACFRRWRYVTASPVTLCRNDTQVYQQAAIDVVTWLNNTWRQPIGRFVEYIRRQPIRSRCVGSWIGSGVCRRDVECTD